MKNLKKDYSENLGQDGHLGGGGYKSAPVKSKKSNWKVYALIAVAVIAILLIVFL